MKDGRRTFRAKGAAHMKALNERENCFIISTRPRRVACRDQGEIGRWAMMLTTEDGEEF